MFMGSLGCKWGIHQIRIPLNCTLWASGEMCSSIISYITWINTPKWVAKGYHFDGISMEKHSSTLDHLANHLAKNLPTMLPRGHELCHQLPINKLQCNRSLCVNPNTYVILYVACFNHLGVVHVLEIRRLNFRTKYSLCLHLYHQMPATIHKMYIYINLCKDV